MKNGVCSTCGSKNIYRSVNSSWFKSGITVTTIGEKINEIFMTEAYLCLDCRRIEVFVDEHAAAIFGKGKTLAESVPSSTNWEKFSG